MELRDWKERSVESASYLADQASANLASRRVDNEEKLKSLSHVAGFGWNEKVMGAGGSRNLSAIMQRAAINPRAKELAKALKVRLRRFWFAAPEPSVGDPRKWRNLTATSGPSGRASGEAWN